MDDLSELNMALFSPHLNTVFTLETDDGVAVSVTLTKCEENPRGTMPNAKRLSFSLCLECAAEIISPNFQSGNLVLVSPAIGRVGPIHVGRILAEPAKAVFQIVFN